MLNCLHVVHLKDIIADLEGKRLYNRRQKLHEAYYQKYWSKTKEDSPARHLHGVPFLCQAADERHKGRLEFSRATSPRARERASLRLERASLGLGMANQGRYGEEGRTSPAHRTMARFGS